MLISQRTDGQATCHCDEKIKLLRLGHRYSQDFLMVGANRISHAMTSSEIFERETRRGRKIL